MQSYVLTVLRDIRNGMNTEINSFDMQKWMHFLQELNMSQDLWVKTYMWLAEWVGSGIYFSVWSEVLY
jgi:hypothetical protein